MMNSKRHINWLNLIFLTVTPLVAIVGTIFICAKGALSWHTVWLAFILVAMGGFSITAGYHRLFSHKTYEAAWPVRLVFLLFGAATFEGSLLEWCTDHRNHHLYTDTPKDPYNFKQGFWYAHIGWLFTLDTKKRDYSNVADLMEDPLIRFQHRFYIPIAIFMGFILPMGIASLWGDPWGGLIIAGALRTTFAEHTTFCINSVCHAFGKQTYSDKYTARDNWFTALLTFGEGYHNFHHQFPLDYRNAIRFYQFDPTKWLIRGLAAIGLASGLKKMSEHKIIQYRIAMDKKRLSQAAEKKSAIDDNGKAALQSLYEPIMQLLSQLDKLEKGYKQLKKSKTSYMQGRAVEYKRLMKVHHKELKEMTTKLKHLMKMWSYLMKRSLLPARFHYDSA